MAGKGTLIDCVQKVKVYAAVDVPGVYDWAGHADQDLSFFIGHFPFLIFHAPFDSCL